MPTRPNNILGIESSSIAESAVTAGTSDAESRHIAGLLAYVERETHVSQRRLAVELGVALGLVNTYIKRCVRKGLIKVQQVPSRRYAYFLTPTGFAEKSRLAAEFLSWSLTFFRRAREEYTELFLEARRRGWTSVAFYGGGDLAEIAALCASEQDLSVVAIVDHNGGRKAVFGVPVVSSLRKLQVHPDGWFITGIQDAQALYDEVVQYTDATQVVAPPMLSVRASSPVSVGTSDGERKR